MKYFEKYFAELTAAVVFIIYLFTLAPTIIHLDAGELTTVQSTLGIAHPTGYPLFTITGYLFSQIFFFIKPVLLLNVLAAVYCAGAVLFLSKLVGIVLDNFDVPNKKSKTKNNVGLISQTQKAVIASVVGLSIGLSKTFWFQSTSVEVYSLHLFLIGLILLVTVKAYYSNLYKHWYILAIILALSFSNHMTTILLLPGIAFLFFKQNRFNKDSFMLIGKMLLIFFPILILLYSYLPIRAMQDPILNWGNPIDFERIIRHVSGKQYQVWIFSSIEAAKKQFVYFVNSLPSELGYVTLITSLIGIPLLSMRAKTISFFLLINFLATVMYSINYDIADIDAYFLLAFISLPLFSIGFITFIIHKIPIRFTGLVFAIPIIMIFVNFSKVDQSEKYAFEDYTKSILDNTTQNGIVFSYLWDYFVSPSYYFQYVEGYRNDVAVIDKELLRRSWYFDQLKKNIPNIMSRIEPQTETFLKSLKPFESDEPFDANVIENDYRALMTSLISSNIEDRDFYLTPELVEGELKRNELQLPPGYTIAPMELAFKVVKNSSGYIPANPESVNIRFSSNPNHYENIVKKMIVNMLVYRIYYELQYEENKKAAKLLDKLQNEFPEYRVPSTILEKLSQ